MNTRQKIGIGIIAPALAFAVGHTVLNKLNNKERITEKNLIDIDNTIKNMSDCETSLFNARLFLQAQDSLINEKKESNKPVWFEENK